MEHVISKAGLNALRGSEFFSFPCLPNISADIWEEIMVGLLALQQPTHQAAEAWMGMSASQRAYDRFMTDLGCPGA